MYITYRVGTKAMIAVF